MQKTFFFLTSTFCKIRDRRLNELFQGNTIVVQVTAPPTDAAPVKTLNEWSQFPLQLMHCRY